MQKQKEELAHKVEQLSSGVSDLEIEESERIKAHSTELAAQIEQYKTQLKQAEKNKRRYVEVRHPTAKTVLPLLGSLLLIARCWSIQVFNKKIVEFKRVVTLVFGYRIELKGEYGDQYFFYPTLEQHKDKCFVLQYNRQSGASGYCLNSTLVLILTSS